MASASSIGVHLFLLGVLLSSFLYSATSTGLYFSVENFRQQSGYYTIPNTHGSRMFYYFFESRSGTTTDPLVLWLTGGPGGSSALAVFYENGPFSLTDDLLLQPRELGWDTVSNIIYVDQPIGVGFSYCPDERYAPQNDQAATEDLYNFLQEFLKDHPKFERNDFYITGESYAGKFIPNLADRIKKGNKASEGIHVNLKGVAIGNGMTSPLIQYLSFGDFALENGITTKRVRDAYVRNFRSCEKLTNKCNAAGTYSACDAALKECNKLRNQLNATDICEYNIKKTDDDDSCKNYGKAQKFLNRSLVKAIIGFGNREFSLTNVKVSRQIGNSGTMLDVSSKVSSLLEDGIKVLVYAGEWDFLCNWLGISRWTDALQWSGQEGFQSAPFAPFMVGKTKRGSVKSYGPFTFLKVYRAGHMVPEDQPEAALHMLKTLMHGKLA